MLAEHDSGCGKAGEESVINHGLGAGRRLLRRLEDRHQGPPPRRACLCEHGRCSHQPRHVHVVAAGVHHRHGLAVVVGSRDRAGIRQAGLFPHRQRIHVGAQHDHGPVAVVQQTNDPRLPNSRGHVKTVGAEPIRRQAGRACLLHGQFGMRMHIGVEGLQPG